MTKLLLIFLLLSGYCSASKDPSTIKIPNYMTQYASLYDLDPILLYAISKVESDHRDKVINHNDGNNVDKRRGVIKNSYGLFQLQLITVQQYGFSAKPEILLDPQINTLFASMHLNKLYKRYKNTLKVLSAYNAGHVTKNNKSYVDKVLRFYVIYKIDEGLK